MISMRSWGVTRVSWLHSKGWCAMFEFYSFLCPDWRGASMVINTSDLSILFANESCSDIFAGNNPIGQRNGRLTFETPFIRSAFCRKLNAAPEGGQEQSAITFLVAGEPHVMTASIRQVPSGWIAPEPFSSCSPQRLVRPVLVEFSQSGYRPDPVCLQSVADAFGLTPAEAHDFSQIALGLSVAEIAAGSGVSISTVRQRIKNILAKTQCERQQGLICLVRSLCPNCIQPTKRPLHNGPFRQPDPQREIVNGQLHA
jgi:DNA-binding CsgD family transcriptional regulator